MGRDFGEPEPHRFREVQDVKKWLPVLLWASLIFTLSHQPGLALPPLLVWDKFLHVGAYFVLGLLLARPFGNHRILIAFLGAALYGLSDEFHQSFIPGRMVESGDLLADAVGGLLGGWAYIRLKKWPRFLHIMESLRRWTGRCFSRKGRSSSATS